MSRSSASRACQVARRTWMWVSSAQTGLDDPLAPDQVLDDRASSSRRWREWVEPADPYRAGLVRRPVREGTALGTRRPGRVPGSAGHDRSAFGGPWRPKAHKQPARRSRGELGAGGRSPCQRRSRRHPRSATGLARHQRVRRGSGPTIIQLLPTVLAASEAPVAPLGQP